VARRLSVVALLLAALAVIVGAVHGVSSGGASSDTPPVPDPHGPMIQVSVPRGASAEAIGRLLQRRGVVADGGRFARYVEAQNEQAGLKPGLYRFRAGTGYGALIDVLSEGPAVQERKLVIPEGFRITQIEQLLPRVGISPAAYARAVREAVPPPGFGHHLNMEGFLFPATYAIHPRETAEQLVSQQIAAFAENVGPVDLSYARAHHLSPYDVLIVASMIEREAQVPGDRAKVSAVIYNRLARGMPLGIDATILYHLGSWTAPITASDLTDPEPYNTRVHTGLPPTPICNPGLAAFQAAARPDHVDYLYYVARPSGGAMYFTKSYQAFLAHGG
jgi:uncharacterized YceG family protein